MDAQSIFVGLIVLGAVGYAGALLLKRLRSFFAPKKTACSDDCGCGTNTKKVMR